MLLTCLIPFLLTQPVQESSITHEVDIPGVCGEDVQVSIPPFDTSLGTLTGVRIDGGLDIDWHLSVENLHDHHLAWGLMSWNLFNHNNTFPEEVGGEGDSFKFIRATVTGTYDEVAFFVRYCPIMYATNNGSRFAAPFDGVADFKGPSSLAAREHQPMMFKGGSIRTDSNLLNLVSSPYSLDITYGHYLSWDRGTVCTQPISCLDWGGVLSVPTAWATSAVRIQYFYI